MKCHIVKNRNFLTEDTSIHLHDLPTIHGSKYIIVWSLVNFMARQFMNWWGKEPGKRQQWYRPNLKNLTVFVADSPRCLEWSSMVAAVSRALRELSEPCLGWTREPRRQPKSLGARRQYSQATANNVLPVMTGSPAFLTRPPPANVPGKIWVSTCYRC